MITEDYVSFEVAKLLKEKGFDEGCDKFYPINGGEVEELTLDELNYYISEFIKAPTHQMAMKYLREVHHLYIGVDVNPIYGKVKDEKGRNTCGLLYWHYIASGEWMDDRYNPLQKAFVVSEKSYKQAIEAALKYVLENLI